MSIDPNHQTAMETKDESRLLALPPELVTRITDNLNHESLPSVRLTCKTLEAATFDRFTETFRVTFCCMYYKSRWLSLKRFLNGSARLVRALRCIYFTTDPLEGHMPSQVQLAPSRDFSDIRAAQSQFDIREADAHFPFEPLEVDIPASSSLVHSVLLDLRELAPHVSITLDLAHTRFFRTESGILNDGIFFALASATLYIHELRLERSCFSDDADFLEHLGPRLLPCISYISAFTFGSTDFDDDDRGEPLDEDNLNIITNMLQSTDRLRRLQLEMGEHAVSGSQWALTQRLLFANNLAEIEDLVLYMTEIPESQLYRAITSCKARLRHLHLGSVRLMDPIEGWSAILRLLATLPQLSELTLSCLVTSEAVSVYNGPRLDFCNIKHGCKLNPYRDTDDRHKHTHLHLACKEDVSAGLQELLSGPLLFTKAIAP